MCQLDQEVLRGDWGNGATRKSKLEKLGHNYNLVQKEVNRLLGVKTSTKKSNSTIANEVVAGEWGNGTVRKNALTKAGYNYNAVQSEVNKKLGIK